MFTVGRVCVKIAGRDADKKCVVVDTKSPQVVLIDGETRRRPCNVRHLLPLDETVDLKKGASHADVVAAFKKLGIELHETKPKQAGKRPRKSRKKKEAREPTKPAAPPTAKTVASEKTTPEKPAAKSTGKPSEPKQTTQPTGDKKQA